MLSSRGCATDGDRLVGLRDSRALMRGSLRLKGCPGVSRKAIWRRLSDCNSADVVGAAEESTLESSKAGNADPSHRSWPACWRSRSASCGGGCQPAFRPREDRLILRPAIARG